MPIPFKQAQKEVIEPVQPLDFHPVTNNVHWVCIRTTVKCERCKADISLELPTVNQTAQVHLFADEAARVVDERNVWVFCAVGCDKRSLPEIEDNVRACKAKLIPNRLPSEWKMHMKDVWSGDARARHPIFSTLSSADVRNYVSEIAALFRRLSDELFTFACAVTRPTSDESDEPMRVAFSVLFSELMHGFTKRGAAPLLHVDAQRPSSIQSQVVGWVQAILNEQRHTLAYPFLTHGIKISKPTFIVPGSAPCAELADFAAYWIARYHERRWRTLPIELDPSELGKIFYVIERAKGEVIVTRQPTFPWMLYSGEMPP
jgi:hypothetical protein